MFKISLALVTLELASSWASSVDGSISYSKSKGVKNSPFEAKSRFNSLRLLLYPSILCILANVIASLRHPCGIHESDGLVVLVDF